MLRDLPSNKLACSQVTEQDDQEGAAIYRNPSCACVFESLYSSDIQNMEVIEHI
jgi:hypothetical protein